MRRFSWIPNARSSVLANPVLLGITRALTDLYEPLMRETLPERWTRLASALTGPAKG